MTKKLTRGQFDTRFELKRYPIPPRKICRSGLHRLLGIASPSIMSVSSGGDIEEYQIQVLRYLCYKRQLRSYQWRMLYRRVREEQKLKILFKSGLNITEEDMKGAECGYDWPWNMAYDRDYYPKISRGKKRIWAIHRQNHDVIVGAAAGVKYSEDYVKPQSITETKALKMTSVRAETLKNK